MRTLTKVCVAMGRPLFAGAIVGGILLIASGVEASEPLLGWLVLTAGVFVVGEINR